ncbi:MAG: hypothetical protein RJA22_2546 [Verrucomicrobiota bacterium]|jgi:predicted PurR-regulated permease PerM
MNAPSPEPARPPAPLQTRLEKNLGWVVLLLLAAGCLVILQPFFTSALWAAVLAFSTWPLYQRLTRWLGGRRLPAALLVTLGMVVVLLLPFAAVGLTLAENVTELKAAARRVAEEGLPGPPAWLARLPAVGPELSDYWASLVADSSKLFTEAKRFIEPVGSLLLKAGLKLGLGLAQLTLSILITFFFLLHGAEVGHQLTAALARIAGTRGQHLLGVAGHTVRGVVHGILGTAMAQALMAAIGFFIAGIPGAAVLALLTFFLSVIPNGPPLIWIPASLWLYQQGRPGWAVFMAIWGLGVSTIDNVVKPWLISQGSDLPFLLMLLGVVGGALAFGFIGVFIGPTLLAVGYRLIQEWAARRPDAPSQSNPRAS